MPKLDESWDKALPIPRPLIWRHRVFLPPRWKQRSPKATAQSPWGSVTVPIHLETSQKKPLSVESYFWGSYTTPQHSSVNQAPLPCSCSLCPRRECHRPMELCPTFRNSGFLGRQQGRVSDADPAHSPCLGAAGAVAHSQTQPPLLGGALRHRTAPSAASYLFGLGSTKGGVVLSSRHSWHQAARSRSLPAGVRALPCPFDQRDFCSQKGSMCRCQQQ